MTLANATMHFDESSEIKIKDGDRELCIKNNSGNTARITEGLLSNILNCVANYNESRSNYLEGEHFLASSDILITRSRDETRENIARKLERQSGMDGKPRITKNSNELYLLAGYLKSISDQTDNKMVTDKFKEAIGILYALCEDEFYLEPPTEQKVRNEQGPDS